MNQNNNMAGAQGGAGQQQQKTRKIDDMLLTQYISMGYNRDVITYAWYQCNGKEYLLLDTIMTIQKNQQNVQSQIQSYPGNNQSGGNGLVGQDQQLQKALMESIKTSNNPGNTDYEPLNLEQRIRAPGVPVGLKNIGNTCYFNSLIQSYFFNRSFVEQVMKAETPIKPYEKKEMEIAICKTETRKKELAGINLVFHLKELFAKMIFGWQKYYNPNIVLKSIVDSKGDPIKLGEQQDIMEFNCNFILRVEEGIQACKTRNSVDVEEQKVNDEENMQMEEEEVKNDDMQMEVEKQKSKLSKFRRLKTLNLASKYSTFNLKKSSIEKLFYGDFKELTYFQENGEEKKLEKNIPFGPIQLNVKYKEFYAALEASNAQDIQNYKNSMGEQVTAFTEYYMTKVPTVLQFSINRYTYDKKDKRITKINDKFDFKKKIYVDRFRFENIKQAKAIQEKVQKIRDQLKQLSSEQEQIEQFGDSQVNMIANLKNSIDFLSSQFDQNLKSELTESKLKDTLYVLYQSKDFLSSKNDVLTVKISELNTEVIKLYETLDKTAYVLSSILIHEGSPQYGHYFSYIYDFEKEVWRRFSDMQITQKDEEEVLLNSRGGKGTVSAYCLLYIKEKVQNQKSNLVNLNFDSNFLDPNRKLDNCFYFNLVSEELKQQIFKSNDTFKIEVVTFQTKQEKSKAKKQFQKIQKHYKSSMEAVNDNYQAISNIVKANQFPVTINFQYFLKSLNKDQLLKYAVLNKAFKTIRKDTNYFDFLNNLDSFNVLDRTLNELIGEKYQINSREIPQELQTDYIIQLDTFGLLYEIMPYCWYTISSAFNNKLLDAVAGLVKLMENKDHDKDQFYFRLTRDIALISCLTSCIKNHHVLFKSKQFQQIIDETKGICMVCSYYSEKKTIQFVIQQIVKILEDNSQDFKQEMPKNLMSEYIQLQEDIKNSNKKLFDVIESKFENCMEMVRKRKQLYEHGDIKKDNVEEASMAVQLTKLKSQARTVFPNLLTFYVYLQKGNAKLLSKEERKTKNYYLNENNIMECEIDKKEKQAS